MVRLIGAAETIYVVGFRRAFPVASYLAYSLQQAGKRIIFVDGVAALQRQQVRSITAKDLLLAVSFAPYAEETVQVVEGATERKAKIVAISDSLVSPVAKPADVVLQVREQEIRKFRSLAATICLAQALVIAYVFDQTGEGRPAAPKRRPGG